MSDYFKTIVFKQMYDRLQTNYEINDKLIDQIESTITDDALLRLTYEINRLDEKNRQIMSVLNEIVQKKIRIDDQLS
jgi:alpha-amylase/alpha-mannosidase (GH57 family)